MIAIKDGDYTEWWKSLAKPFKSEDYEWRLSQCGKSGDKFWAKCLCYVTNRAIMQRLDDVVGVENWKNFFDKAPDSGVLCGISIKVNGEWLTKWDGAGNTDIEAVKGGISDAMKRAAVQWGIGRCLYKLTEGFGVICVKGTTGAKYGKTKKNEVFYWLPPELPAWAVDGESAGNGGSQGKKDGDKSEKKTYKNFSFLGKMKAYKNSLSEKVYYAMLGNCGYEHSNEIPPEKQSSALKAFGAKQKNMKGNQ